MSNQAFALQSENYPTAAAVLARAFADDPAILAILKSFAVKESIRVLTIPFGANQQRCDNG